MKHFVARSIRFIKAQLKLYNIGTPGCPTFLHFPPNGTPYTKQTAIDAGKKAGLQYVEAKVFSELNKWVIITASPAEADNIPKGTNIRATLL